MAVAQLSRWGEPGDLRHADVELAVDTAVLAAVAVAVAAHRQPRPVVRSDR